MLGKSRIGPDLDATSAACQAVIMISALVHAAHSACTTEATCSPAPELKQFACLCSLINAGGQSERLCV
jgi:hypothetical protein